MATIAVGDIHGNRDALADLLDRVAPTLNSDDTLVFLGDYVDRGPDAKGCIELILGLEETFPASVVTLLGNHEDWLIRTWKDHSRHSWLLGMDALRTVESYSAAAARTLRRAAEQGGLRLITESVTLPYDVFFESMPESHKVFFESLRTHHRTPDCLCVHGGVDPSKSLDEQSRRDFIWGTEEFPQGYTGRETIVYGHWDNARLDSAGWPHPLVGRNSVGLDTVSHGVLTAIRLPERQVLQSARYA